VCVTGLLLAHPVQCARP